MPRSRRLPVLAVGLLVAGLLLADAFARPASANLLNGPAITGEHNGWTFVPIDTIRAWIEESIQKNQTNPPPGNPGPFTRGYSSIVILDGQCYSRGIYSILGMGTNIVIGGAADWQKEAKWYNKKLGVDTTQANWLWLEELLKQIRSNPNRPIKDILGAVKTANPDPEADTPDPDNTAGGEGVVLGNPQDQPGLSYHAVLFAGKLSDKTGALKESEDAATRKAINHARDTLINSCHVPAENIRTVHAPATWDSLKNAIQDTWTRMNDNEQFIFLLADHSNYLNVPKANAWVPPLEDPEEQEAEVPTEEYSVSPGVIRPELLLESSFALTSATVSLNGVAIGTLPATLQPIRVTLQFSRQLLVPVGQMNKVRVGASMANVIISRYGLGTGPVAGTAHNTTLPALDRLGLAGAALLCLAAGVILTRRRFARAN